MRYASSRVPSGIGTVISCGGATSSAARRAATARLSASVRTGRIDGSSTSATSGARPSREWLCTA
jgi:hypothetical protein